MILWRPVGLAEMALIHGSDLRAYPPRLPQQPIFYPVLNEAYARAISRNWNATESPYAGYVTRCEVADDFARRYPPQVVGGRDAVELWIPATDLAGFNEALLGPIRVTSAHFGRGFRGWVPSSGPLAGLDARGQLPALTEADTPGRLASLLANSEAARAVFLNYPYWCALAAEPGEASLPARLHTVRMQWQARSGAAPVCEEAELLPPSA